MLVQGDVFLVVERGGIPDGVKRVERVNGRLVLAEGESTGHAHVIVDDGPELYERDGVLWLKAPIGCTVTHEEHKPITVAPGEYRVGRVREYDAFTEATRVVTD